MPVTAVQLPTFVFLIQAHRHDVIVVFGSQIPAIQRITINPESRPAEMFAQQQFRLDRRRTEARGKRDVLTIGAWQHGTGANVSVGIQGAFELQASLTI